MRRKQARSGAAPPPRCPFTRLFLFIYYLSLLSARSKYNIRVNSVCAGTIETPISADERKAHGWTYAEWEALKIKDVMLGRVGNTREIADATLFFACHESSYCTATHLMVDGGQTPCTVME